MRRRLFPILALFCVLVPYLLSAQISPSANSLMKLFQAKECLQIEMLGEYECLINLNLPFDKYSITEEDIPSILRTALSEGSEPLITGYLNLPPSSGVKIEIMNYEHNAIFAEDAEFNIINFDQTGNQVINFSSGSIAIGKPVIMRDLRLAPIAVRLYHWDEELNKLNITKQLSFRCTFPAGNAENQKRHFAPMSGAFKDIYEKYVWNFSGGCDDFSASNYLIICPDIFAEAALPLYHWKNQKGVRTTLVTFSEINANSNDENIIRNFIETAYYEWEYPPDYVLLVGDNAWFPIHMDYTDDPPTPFSYYTLPGYYINDNYFACIEGEDYFPDVILGRLCVPNSTGVMKLVSKIITYEKTPNMIYTDWYNKGIMCADQTEPTQRSTKLYVRNIMLDDGGFVQVDTLFVPDQSSVFMNWVNDGRSFINYRGSGWSNGWAGVGVYISNLNGLYNYFELPVVTGIGCGASKFDNSGQCFGEAWMNAGTLNNHLGSIAFIGPTWNTHTHYNNYLDRGIYEALFQDSVRNIGDALVAGKMEVQTQFELYIAVNSSVEEIVRVLFGQYILMSDPELTTRAAPPQQISVTHNDSVLLGPGTFEVTVTDTAGAAKEGLQVCAFIDGETFAVDLSDAIGEVSLQVNPQTRPNYMYITVSGLDIAPYFDSLEVSAESQFISHYYYEIIEDPPGDGLIAPGETIMLSEQVKNYGIEDAYEVYGIFTCANEEVLIEIDSSYFGDLAPDEDAWGDVDYRFTLPEDYTALTVAVTLTFHDSESFNWVSEYPLPVQYPDLVFEEFEVDPGPDGILERGGEAEVIVYIQNIGSLPLIDITGDLISLDTEVEIVSGTYYFGDIDMGETVENEDEPFIIRVNDYCPNDFLAHFQLNMSGEQGAFNYSDCFDFEFIVGEPSAVDPTIDEQEIYYAYEARDSFYVQAPQYEWVEISPYEGGTGTLIEFDQESQVALIDLPFNWTYYGEDFSRLTVSADGFIVPDSIGFSIQPYYSVIFQDDAPGAVAPLWFDQYCLVYEPGDVSYLYNANDGSFRIEYHQWSHANSNLNQETYQIAIYDPNVRITQTGDAEIEFIYQDVGEWALTHSTCGIENPQQIDGIDIWHNTNRPNTVWPPIPYTTILFTTNEPEFVDVDDFSTGNGLIPSAVFLQQNYPNPFNPSTTISFGIPAQTGVKLEVYNILGGRVAVLVDGKMEAGVYDIQWNSGSYSSGIYFFRLTTPQSVKAVKCLLIK